MKTFFASLTIDQLTSIGGGAAPNGNTGITGGLEGIHNHVPGCACCTRSGTAGVAGGSERTHRRLRPY